MTTADIGPIQEAAALTDLIETIRAELAHLVAWRSQKLDETRALIAAPDGPEITVAEIAEQVRLSRGRVSQVTTKRRGRQTPTGSQQKAKARVVTAAPQIPIVSQEA